MWQGSFLLHCYQRAPAIACNRGGSKADQFVAFPLGHRSLCLLCIQWTVSFLFCLEGPDPELLMERRCATCPWCSASLPRFHCLGLSHAKLRFTVVFFWCTAWETRGCSFGAPHGGSVGSFAMPITAVGLTCCPVPTGPSHAGTADGEGRAHMRHSPGAHSPAVHVLPWAGLEWVFGGQCKWYLSQVFPKIRGLHGCEQRLVAWAKVIERDLQGSKGKLPNNILNW